jgi:hypothetical protein
MGGYTKDCFGYKRVIANAKRQTTQNKNSNFDKWKIDL